MNIKHGIREDRRFSCDTLIGQRQVLDDQARDGGVRMKEIELHPENWDFVDVSWADEKRVLEYFRKTDHMRYGWWTLITSQLLNRGMSSNKAQFCSEWCARALGTRYGSIFSPGTLGGVCKEINEAISATQPDAV